MTSADCGIAGEAANHQHPPPLSAYEREALNTVHQAMVYVGLFIREGRIATEDKARIHDLADVLQNVPLIVARGRADREKEYVDSCLAKARMLMAA